MTTPSKHQPEKEGYWSALMDAPRESPFKQEELTRLWLKGYDEAVEDFDSED